MRILGIDPGYAIIGYGVIDYEHSKMRLTAFGAVTTSADMPFERRLNAIYDDMCCLVQTYKPDEAAIEKLYFNTNQKTVIDVAQARGVTLLPLIRAGLPIFEYTPLQVKSSIAGYGRAEKKQVQEMTKNLLHLAEIPKPDDAADAVALAITHAYSVNTRSIMDKYKEQS
ncbi:MAG: crossover junction endodeoxyribonuclease RuvC [Ruminococcus sp.]|nr:crossover junction endodeoxyribonuclease RuvC [Ruminococcus sp.]